MSEFTEAILRLKAHLDAITVHLGSSTHDEKQGIAEAQLPGLVVRMREIIAMVEAVMQTPAEPTAAELGAAAREAGEPSTVSGNRILPGPPSGIIRSGK
jgi:hypothetical protein